MQNLQAERLPKGHKVASPGAAIATIGFFLPWVLASCEGQAMASFSGWDLATGSTINLGFYAQQLPGQPAIFLILLAGLGALGLAYLALRRGAVRKLLDGLALAGLGGLALLIVLSQFSGAQEDAAREGIALDYQLGFWAVVLGHLAVVIGGVMNLIGKGQSLPVSEATQASASPPPEPRSSAPSE